MNGQRMFSLLPKNCLRFLGTISQWQGSPLYCQFRSKQDQKINLPVFLIYINTIPAAEFIICHTYWKQNNTSPNKAVLYSSQKNSYAMPEKEDGWFISLVLPQLWEEQNEGLLSISWLLVKRVFSQSKDYNKTDGLLMLCWMCRGSLELRTDCRHVMCSDGKLNYNGLTPAKRKRLPINAPIGDYCDFSLIVCQTAADKEHRLETRGKTAEWDFIYLFFSIYLWRHKIRRMLEQALKLCSHTWNFKCTQTLAISCFISQIAKNIEQTPGMTGVYFLSCHSSL